MRSARAQAFTLIELVVTISIILLLIGMLFMSFRWIGVSSKEKATRATMENARSMLTEYEGQAGFGRQPGVWWWGTPSPNTLIDPVNDAAYSVKRLNFWRVPERSGLDDTGNPEPLDAPTDVTATPAGVDRNTHWAIRNTQAAFGLMQAVKTNHSGISKIAGELIFVPNWDSALTYQIGNTVKHNGVTYRASAVSTGIAPPSASWNTSGTMSLMMQDAWANPIIFVPASGLANVVVGGTAQTISAAGGRPFFASAGPDGNFREGDDNVYSFDN